MAVDWHHLIPTRRSLLNRLRHWDDNQSWEDFHRIYHPLIFGAAISSGLTEEEAQDAAQDTIVAVAKSIKKFKYDPEQCTFKTWLHSITKRQVANQFRKRQDKTPLPTDGEDAAVLNDLPDPAGQALDEKWEREWEETLLKAAIHRVKGRTSPKPFAIYDYHVLQRHSVRETARSLGVTAGDGLPGQASHRQDDASGIDAPAREI